MRIGINDPDDRTIRRGFVTPEWERSLFAAAPEDKLPGPRTYGVQSNCGASLGLKVGIQRLDDKELSAVQSLILNTGNHGSDYTCDLHS